LIDSHCHLQVLPADECERALDEARQVGVRGFLVPAIRLEDAERLLELSNRHEDVWCALGVHPHEASSWRRGDGRRLEQYLSEPKVVAVGECGLDFHYDNSPRETQIRVMRRQWEIALEHDLPVVVHNRESNEAMMEVLARPELEGLRGDFHSFAGGLEMAKSILEKGFYVGLSGMITFPRADNVREVIPELPESRALVETDTPYLAPVPHRGTPNQPAWVREIAKRLAEERGVGLAEIVASTTANFFRLFGKAVG